MCSPSPCESIATLTDDEQADDDELQAAAAAAGQEDEDRHSIESPQSVATTPINESREKLFPINATGTSGCATPTPQHLFNENFDEFSGSQSSAQQQRSMKSYLHTFDRRNSDTTYLLGRRSSGERVNLADEIRKLSDHLFMLAEINTKLGDANNSSSGSTKEAAATESKSAKTETNSSSSSSKAQEAPKWTSTTRTSSSTSSRVTPLGLLNSSSSSTSSSSQSHSLNKAGQQKLSSSLSVRLQQSIEETPKLSNGNADSWLKSQQQQSQMSRSVKSTVSTMSTSNAQSSSSSSSSSHVVQSSSSKISSSSHNHVLSSESASSRRAKYRINQMSRDVPIGLPDTHQTVNLEEAANTTKDCLLHLLEKYNETKNRNPVGRHQSISVDSPVSDKLEYRSISSINAFFQRHVHSSSTGQNVKQIQAQLEERATGK